MADKTGIEWTDATWNPIRGCSRVSEGCRNCYAEGVANRFKGPGQPYHGLIARTGQWNGAVMVVEHLLDWPLRKRKPMRIFVNSMSDLFHENLPDEWIDQVFAVMALAKQHTFQVLTKRPERMLRYFTDLGLRSELIGVEAEAIGGIDRHDEALQQRWPLPLPNVWLGVSVEDQATADERIPLLLQTPAAVRWISAEPLLGSVDLSPWLSANALHEIDGGPRLDWVVVGGESGRNARPMHPDWVKSLRDQCKVFDVPFLFKQHGEWLATSFCDDETVMLPSKKTVYVRPDGTFHDGSDGIDFFGGDEETAWVGKKAAGRMLDGIIYDQYPR